MKRITLRTVSVLGLSAWAIASGCSGGSGSADADGEGVNVGNGGDGNDGNSGANDNTGDDQNSGDAGVPLIDAGAGVDGTDAEDNDAGTDDTGGAGGTSATAGATSSAGSLGTAGTGGASSQAPVEPTVLVPFGRIVGLGGQNHIEVDDEYVYWSSAWVGADPAMPLPTPTGSYLLRAPKNGGEVSALYEAPNGLSGFFAMDDENLYVSEGVDIYSSLIVRVPKDGSAAVQLATPAGLNRKAWFAIDDEYLYFEGSNPGDIEKVALGGGPIVPVIDTETPPVPAFPEGLTYFPAVNGLTTDGTHLYYSGNLDGIFQVPVGGGQPVRISPQNSPLDVEGARFSDSYSWPAVRNGFVIWKYYSDIYQVPVGGGTLTTVLDAADSGSNNPDTVIDGDYAYYIDAGLQKAALDGSGRVTLLEDTGNYNVGGSIAIDDTSVYMWAASGQSIIKVAK